MFREKGRSNVALFRIGNPWLLPEVFVGIVGDRSLRNQRWSGNSNQSLK
jgi:hypothetical protein